MKHFSKVVWSEGMYLAPQHFQAQARSFEELIQFSTSSLWFAPYGFLDYELDDAALRNGLLSLRFARGIFSDGLAFNMPAADPAPLERNVSESFPSTLASSVLSLAVAPSRPDGQNCAVPPTVASDGQFRFTSELRKLYDDNTGKDEQMVPVARKNIRFVLDTEEREDSLLLPIARVARDGTGHLAFDRSFIPPCLRISASERLMRMTRRLIEILEVKSASMSATRSGGIRAGFSAQEVASFWFVHTVNSSLAVLRHLCLSERGHPEQLYLELARLAGALCTFGLSSNPQSLPLYNHDDLTGCFHALDSHIRAHLELVLPSNCISVSLQQSDRYYYEGEIKDERCLGRSQWILAVRSEMGELELIMRSQKLIKFCSGPLLREVVKTALPGLGLSHFVTPPTAVAPRVEYQYFGINRSGRQWEDIVHTRRVGVYIPGEIPNPELELLVIVDS
jgi:type VI secretion system protein ImpJ